MIATCSKETMKQFLRYIFAGGFAFVVDFTALVLFREFVFKGHAFGVYASVMLAFFAGHLANYVLSMWFVFTDADERRRGLTLRAFWMFALCAFLGMGVTELGMWIGYGLMHFHYVFIKIVMAAMVFLMNFVGRKIIVTKC